MTFFQFASNNVRRNTRAYAAYFLSSTFAILVFFLYATLASHPDLHKGYVRELVVNGMQIAEYIIFFFAFFSILYSMGSFLKGRSKEFGLLTLLGISNRQLVLMVFLENMLLGLTSLVVGILLGLVGSKLFLLLGSAVLDIPPLPFYIPVQALLITCIAFSLLFLLVSLGTTLFIRTNNVNTLLKGTRKPRKEPRALLILTLLAAGCLIAGYGLAITYDAGKGSQLIPLVIIVLVAIGTYFLYSQMSVFLINMLKKRRSFYWRGTQLLWLSDLTYSMKDNARLFFAIAMILSVSFTATSALSVIKAQLSPQEMPFAFSLAFEPGNTSKVAQLENTMSQSLHNHHLAYTKVQASYARVNVKGRAFPVAFMSVSEYNRLAVKLQAAPLSVQPGNAAEVITTPSPDQYNPAIPDGQTIILQRPQEAIHVVGSNNQHVLNGGFTDSYALIVPDRDYQQYTAGLPQNLYVGYIVPQWRDTLDFAFALENQLYAQYGDTNKDSRFLFSSHAADYFVEYQLPNIMLFIGLFVALIFLLASCSFLYFRLYSSLTENTTRYRAITKIGLSTQEMHRSMTTQMALLFFAPFLLAIVHTIFATWTMKNNMHAGAQVFLPTVATIGGFLLFQLVYFLIVRMQYLHQLDQAVVAKA